MRLRVKGPDESSWSIIRGKGYGLYPAALQIMRQPIVMNGMLESHVFCLPQCVRATSSRRVCLRYFMSYRYVAFRVEFRA